jgi:formate C-acetyltransferase
MMPSLAERDFGARRETPLRRLSERTRDLAARALAGEHSRAMTPAEFAIAPEFYLSLPTPNAQYAEAVRLIAERAPLCVLPGEKILGSATLLEAARHRVPALPLYAGTSHTTIGFERVLAVGYRGLRADVRARLDRGRLDAEGVDLLQAMLKCLDAAEVWRQRHVALLQERLSGATPQDATEYRAALDTLLRVPEEPPRTFREAVQAIWFVFGFQRLCGNWSGVGRIDKLLGPYLKRDVAEGRITLDEARELIAHFWIKGAEWAGLAFANGSGDAQFYQNIVLAGLDEEGREVANEVTDLVLDVVEELRISDFPIAVRLNSATPERLLRRVAEVQRLGGGIVAVYNEERIIANLVAFGYPLAEARNFANDGCWEVIIPGRTCFGYSPFDVMLPLQEALGLTPGTPTPDYADFESLYAAFRARLAKQVTDAVNSPPPARGAPTPLLSLFVEDCVERGRPYHEGGPRYSVRAPHAGGLPDAANSLLALRHLVYEQRAATLPEFVAALRNNWEGREELRRRALALSYYGNDDPAADAVLARVFNDFTDFVALAHERFGLLRPAGISTFGRQIDWVKQRAAAAHGHRKGDILAGNLTPTPGSDRLGPTAVIKSHCAVDFSRLPNGTVLDLKILPATLRGEPGVASLVALMRTFVNLGGIFLHIDVVDGAQLREAQAHPDRHPNLAVRCSGWSARFATLSREWQDMVIQRTEQAMR